LTGAIVRFCRAVGGVSTAFPEPDFSRAPFRIDANEYHRSIAMNIEQLLGRHLPVLPVAWILLSALAAKAQEHPVVMAPSQFGSRPSVFVGYGPGFGYAPGVGYGYGFSPRFAPVPNPRYGYGPRLTAGFGTGYPYAFGPPYGFGPGFGDWGSNYGLGYGFFYPAAFGSFWTNGLTLYGPPVPTFGVTPGSFGGSDAHRTYFLQEYYGLDWDAYQYKSRMPYGWEPTAKWATECRVCAVALPAPSSADRARISIRVPHPDAELWIGTTRVKAIGSERVYEAPVLDAEKSAEYEFIARWRVGDEWKAESRTVSVKRGDSVEVDFNKEK